MAVFHVTVLNVRDIYNTTECCPADQHRTYCRPPKYNLVSLLCDEVYILHRTVMPSYHYISFISYN